MYAVGPYFLGVDGGQSSTKAAVGDACGRIVGRSSGGPCVHPVSAPAKADLESTLRHLIATAAGSAGLPANTRFRAACFGLSGLFPEAVSAAAGLARCEAADVVSDAEVALEGATGGGPGIAVIAGTGSIALAREDGSAVSRCGGWGYLFGDDGAAFDIVRQALRKALADEEGWGGRTALSKLFRAATGAGSVNEALHLLYGPDWPRDRVAGLAAEVDRTSNHGDTSARKVLSQAGNRLAVLALRAARALPSRGVRLPVYALGGVFSSCILRTAFERRILAEQFSLGTPLWDGPAGALLRAYALGGLAVSLHELA